MAQPINWRPTSADARAIAYLREQYPFLTSVADVLRFALHQTVANHQAGDGSIAPAKHWTPEERAALKAEIDEELRKLENRKKEQE